MPGPVLRLHLTGLHERRACTALDADGRDLFYPSPGARHVRLGRLRDLLARH
jgi:hypothetical protein